MVVHAFSVNEFSVWRMLWYLLLRRRVRILAVFSIYTAFDRPLRWLVDRLTAKGRIARLGDDIEALAPLQDDPARAMLSDYFNRIEPWLENYFGFGDPDPGHSGYHRVFQHLTCNYIALQAVQIVAPSIAAARSPEIQVRFYGYPKDIAAAACAFAGRDALPQITTMRSPDRLLNLLFSLALAAYSAAWLGKATEWGGGHAQTVENPVTRCYTAAGIRRLFAGFAGLSLRKSEFYFYLVPKLGRLYRRWQVRRYGTHPGGVPVYGEPWPIQSPLERFLGPVMGWAWYIAATKPAPEQGAPDEPPPAGTASDGPSFTPPRPSPRQGSS